jgi:uncharacterized membrane protein YdbT with pleckstrin-like domain
MSWVDRHLTTGEDVVFHTRFHPVVFAGTATFAACVVGVVALVVTRNELPRDTVRLLWLGGLALAIVSFVPPTVRWRSAEFAVTTRRVLVKIGFLSVHTLELLLPKVEAIGVDQPIAGRLLGYGTLRIVGTGGTVEEFDRVARPDGVREAVVRQAAGSSPARAR